MGWQSMQYKEKERLYTRHEKFSGISICICSPGSLLPFLGDIALHVFWELSTWGCQSNETVTQCKINLGIQALWLGYPSSEHNLSETSDIHTWTSVPTAPSEKVREVILFTTRAWDTGQSCLNQGRRTSTSGMLCAWFISLPTICPLS